MSLASYLPVAASTPQRLIKPFIPNDAEMCQSVLCERPTTTREPIHTGALLAVMGIGLFALVIAVIWRHLERRADRGEQ